ncbi:MAG: lipoprotein-anchoring transpeptidase ErfK/SrfK [Ilumatobacter sp.]
MNPRQTAIALTASALIIGACANGGTGRDASVPVPGAAAAPINAGGSDQGLSAPAAATAPDAAALVPTATASSAPGTEADESTKSTSTTTTSSTTTTTVPELDVYEPSCVVEVQPGDSLGLITDSFDDETINISTVRAENSLEGDTIFSGQVLDICVDNGLDDITGSERERNPAIVAEETVTAVKLQQTQLNTLFAGYGIRDLQVDGVSGPVTRQRLCAARLGLALDVTLTDMEPGSEEEAALMAADTLSIPFTTAALSEHWILIDRTCQIMFVGEAANQLKYIFPTSTGSQGYETRDQDRSRVFRYDPALDNDGWHDSTDFPVAIDNPLNGNMYRPLYFDGGQAIHGANNVPTTPQSKGCARLRPGDQDQLVAWLGLQDAQGPQGAIPVTVNVQGEYVHDILDAVSPDAVSAEPDADTIDT